MDGPGFVHRETDASDHAVRADHGLFGRAAYLRSSYGEAEAGGRAGARVVEAEAEARGFFPPVGSGICTPIGPFPGAVLESGATRMADDGDCRVDSIGGSGARGAGLAGSLVGPASGVGLEGRSPT